MAPFEISLDSLVEIAHTRCSRHSRRDRIRPKFQFLAWKFDVSGAVATFSRNVLMERPFASTGGHCVHLSLMLRVVFFTPK
jgi:hypothetical protein